MPSQPKLLAEIFRDGIPESLQYRFLPEGSREERVPRYEDMHWLIWRNEARANGVHDIFPNMGGDAVPMEEKV